MLHLIISRPCSGLISKGHWSNKDETTSDLQTVDIVNFPDITNYIITWHPTLLSLTRLLFHFCHYLGKVKGKVKVTLVQSLRLCTGRMVQWGSRVIALHFQDHSTRRGWGVSISPRPLYPQERTITHCTGGWVGPRAGLDRCRKSRPPPRFNPRTVQPVASRYTDYATRPTHYLGNTVYI